MALSLTRLGFRLASTQEDVVYTYYEYRGWTPDGIPSNETLERLKL